jgi:hypothetical protein
MTTTTACKQHPQTTPQTARVALRTLPGTPPFRVEVCRRVSSPAREEELRRLACRQWLEHLVRRIRETRVWWEGQTEGETPG